MRWIFAVCLMLALAPASQASGVPLSNPGTLRDQVPAEALAYVRIPGPFAALMAQQGPGLGSALADPRITEALDTIRSAFLARVEAMPADLREPVSSLLLGHLRSPVEAIALMVTVKERPQPLGLITMTLDLNTVDEVNQLIRSLESASPNLSYMAQMSPGQPGVVSFGGAAVGVVFEPATRRLSLIVGPALSRELIAGLLSLPPNPNHPMRLAEAQIDETGQGLFVWADVQQGMPFLQLAMEPTMLVELERWGLLNATAIAFGAGTAGGNGKVRLQLDVARSGLLRLLPVADQDVTVKTRGEPGLAVVVNGLHADATTRIEQVIGTMGSRAKAREFRARIAEMAVEAGFSIDDVLAALGPQLVGFSDDAGEYLAIGIRDRQRLRQVLAAMAQLPQVSLTTRKSGNIDIVHLKVEVPSEPDENPYVTMLEAGSVVQLFWAEQADHLVFAALPQVLRDRYARQPAFALGPWLARNAGSPVDSAALMASARFDGIPRFLYTQYLGGVFALSAMTQADIDLFELPSAAELGLPPDGALALTVAMSAEQLALEISFDGSPLDVLVAPGASGTVAVVGVLAAVAIPAYQDYTIRARVQALATVAQPARTAVGIACSENTLQAGMSNTALNLPPPAQLNSTYAGAVEVQVQSATRAQVQIAVRNLGGGIKDGETIVYEGTCQPAGMRWQVRGSLPEKYWPKH